MEDFKTRLNEYEQDGKIFHNSFPVTMGGDFEVNEAIQKSQDDLTKQLSESQKQYRTMFDQMSLLKNDIEQVQKLIQQNRAKLVKEFEEYQKKKEKVGWRLFIG
jgi:hypothetical protein